MSSAFLTALVLQPLPDGRRAKLVKDLVYRSALLGGGTVIVPEGFTTDYASVPRGFWNVLPPVGRYNEPAIVHDYLYATGEVSRGLADSIFLEAMKVKGCRWTQRWTLYLAVRAFGWCPWRVKRKANEDETTV